MNNQSSFATAVKEEIASRSYQNERLLAIVSAFTRINGTLVIKDKREYILLKLENSKIAKFLYASIQKLFQISPTISYLKKKSFHQNTCYLISVESAHLLNQLHIDFLESKIDKSFAKNTETIGGYLAGAFLASGSVNSPRSSNYHLEIACNDLSYAKWFTRLMSKYHDSSFMAKIIKRRDKYIVYLKRSDQISDFLVLVGATDACLYFENTRVDRDYANVLNRMQNLDTANLSKTLKTAKQDIKIINKLIKRDGLVNLGSEKMITLCELRIKYPEASLDELATHLSKAMGETVSKSNVNHLLRALREEGKNL
ncbi:MAG: DNA-binding protein WhiA [Bacilli bacterium]|nr:DNA-binding protein WhiA [Bacilli bacterium]